MPITTPSDTGLIDAVEAMLLGYGSGALTLIRQEFVDGTGRKSYAVAVGGINDTFGSLREMLTEVLTRRAAARLEGMPIATSGLAASAKL